jgi:hypothetical protein
MAIKFINIFQSESLQNLPELEFLVWKETIWQPCCCDQIDWKKHSFWAEIIDDVKIDSLNNFNYFSLIITLIFIATVFLNAETNVICYTYDSTQKVKRFIPFPTQRNKLLCQPQCKVL